MSEYNMTHTGKELDDAINKVKNGYINLADVINHCTKSASDSYKPPSNLVMNDVFIPVTDSNGNSFKPKIFVLFHNSRIENSGTNTSTIAVTSSVMIVDDNYANLYRHTTGIYYHSTYKACANQSGSRYFKPTDTGVQGVGSDFYLQSGKEYLWYAWG